MVSQKEKEYYNIYLAASRTSRGKPFRARANFDDFEKSPEYPYLRKVTYFLSQFPQIKPSIYFRAPYELYEDEEWFDLKFFSSQKAIKAYTTYFQKLSEKSPDSETNIKFIRESLHFIGMFCLKNKIQVEEYPTFSLGATKAWMKHLREHKISIYTIFAFPGIMSIIGETPPDELDLFFGGDMEKLHIYRNRYMTSKEAKPLLKEGIARINSFVRRNSGGD